MIRTFLRRLFEKGPSMLDIGEPAPDFTALDHEGRTVCKADFEGKRFLLWFYPKADTPG